MSIIQTYDIEIYKLKAIRSATERFGWIWDIKQEQNQSKTHIPFLTLFQQPCPFEAEIDRKIWSFNALDA